MDASKNQKILTLWISKPDFRSRIDDEDQIRRTFPNAAPIANINWNHRDGNSSNLPEIT